MLSNTQFISRHRSPGVLTPTIPNRYLLYDFESGNANDVWNGRNGTVYGSCVNTTRSKNGSYSATSDGQPLSSKYIQVPALTFTASQGISFSFWFFRSGVQGSDVVMMEFNSDNTYLVWLNNSSSATNAGLWYNILGSASGIAINTWYHFASTTASNGAYIAYLNGTSFTTGTVTALNGTLPSGKVLRTGSTSHVSLLGSIDEFRIYNKVLTQAEVTGLYNGSIS